MIVLVSHVESSFVVAHPTASGKMPWSLWLWSFETGGMWFQEVPQGVTPGRPTAGFLKKK